MAKTKAKKVKGTPLTIKRQCWKCKRTPKLNALVWRRKPDTDLRLECRDKEDCLDLRLERGKYGKATGQAADGG
jgi:hypothetical protein